MLLVLQNKWSTGIDHVEEHTDIDVLIGNNYSVVEAYIDEDDELS